MIRRYQRTSGRGKKNRKQALAFGYCWINLKEPKERLGRWEMGINHLEIKIKLNLTCIGSVLTFYAEFNRPLCKRVK